MKYKLRIIKIYFEYIRCSVHLVLFLFGKNRNIIEADVTRWMQIKNLNYNTTFGFLYLLSFFPEFRNLFYVRIGLWKHFLNIICPQMSSLFIVTDRNNIGKGLYIEHGIATLIGALSIGDNCWINQQVTIGFTDASHPPVLGNNVLITSGSKIIGNVRIGDNCKIGANAVVLSDVPANCTVVGIPAYIVKRDGVKTNEKL